MGSLDPAKLTQVQTFKSSLTPIYCLFTSFFYVYNIDLKNSCSIRYLPLPWRCINILQSILQSSPLSQRKLYLVLLGLLDVSHTIFRPYPESQKMASESKGWLPQEHDVHHELGYNSLTGTEKFG